MNHLKTYQSEDYYIHDKQFVIEGPLTHEDLKALTFDAYLTAFRDAEDQFEALLEITTLPEGRIYVARQDKLIVGYVTFHY
ncbi:TPA: N-acetyltransferase, partial [Staphylococcus aureus]|nr:N-acetyltransferase [Staphylococcus aureus]